MGWITFFYMSFSFLRFAFRIEAEIILTNGTYIMRKTNDNEDYTVIREISYSTLILKSSWIPCLEVDWREEKLFWFEKTYLSKAIHTSNLDGTVQKIINTKDLKCVTSMAVDERNKILYWSDSSKKTIERADYDGKNGRIIHSNHLSRIEVLAVDPTHALLYWREERSTNKLFSSKTDGSDLKMANNFDQSHQILVKVVIEIQQESDSNLLLYWRNDDSTKSFSNCSTLIQCRNQNLTTGMTDGLNSVSFAIRPKYRQNQQDGVCKNMGCSHVCMPTNETYARCSCPSFGGLVLVSERNCSTVSEPFLLYSDESAGCIGIADLYPRYPNPDNFLVAKQTKPRGIAYEKIEKMVYFYEESIQTIFKIKIDGTGLTEVLSLQDGNRTTIKALAVDSVQRRLYFTLSRVYRTNESDMVRIEALDLESNHRRTVIVGEDINQDILFILHDRLHFVHNMTCMLSDMDGFNATQGSCSTNAYMEKLITNELLLNFVVDEQDESEIIVRQRGDKIEIWKDQTKTISAFNLQGIGRFAIATTAIISNGTGSICNKVAGKRACKSLCFRTSNESIARCHCPTYRFNVLQEDVRNCSAPKDFLLFSEGTEIRMIGRGRTPDTSVYTIAESSDGVIESFAFQWPHVYFITRKASSEDHMPGSQALYRKSVESLQTETVTTFDTPVRLIHLYGNRIYSLSYDEDKWTIRSVSLNGSDTRIHFERNMFISNVYTFDTYGNVFIIFDDRIIVLGENITAHMLCFLPEQINPTSAIIDNANRILYVSTGLNIIGYISARPDHLSRDNWCLGWKRINFQAPSPNETSITSMALSSGRLHVILKSFQNRKAILVTLDLTMTNISKTEEINANDPRGLLAFIQKNRDSYEPGTVIRTGSCPTSLQENDTCLENQCITDYGCGGNGQICCPRSRVSCKKCVRPVSKHQYIDAKCKICTNGVCSDLVCPPNGGCIAMSKLNCCPICLDITDCPNKPIIEGCPNDVFNFTLPNNNDSVQINVSVQPFNAIRAYNCSSGRRLIPVELQKETLTWQNEVQQVDVIAKDMNGESVCKVSVKVRDVTAPWFISCPSDMEFYSKDLFTSATWFDPVADDNVAKPPILQQEDKHYKSPMELSVGTVYSFKYTAKDNEGNRGPPCSFTISALKLDTPCSSPPQIQQGSLFCKGDPDSMECVIKECAKDFIMLTEFNHTYRCQNGEWVPTFNDRIQTGACLKMEFLSLALQLNVDLLNTDIKTPTKADIIECFKKLSLCPEPKTNNSYHMCTEKNIQLIRNETILHLEVNTTHQLGFNETVEGVNSELNKTMTALSLGFSKGSISTYCLKLTGQIQAVLLKEYIFCEPGSILLPSKINCTLCPPGEYEAGSICRQCPREYYTNLPGQTECVKCDGDKTTHRLASYSKDHCVSMAATTPPSSNTILIVGIVCGTLLLISIVVGVTVYKVRKAKKSSYSPGAFMDQTYLGLTGKTDENPYDKQSIYDEIPADAVM